MPVTASARATSDNTRPRRGRYTARAWLRKSKCDGLEPCSRCAQRSLPCVYPDRSHNCKKPNDGRKSLPSKEQVQASTSLGQTIPDVVVQTGSGDRPAGDSHPASISKTPEPASGGATTHLDANDEGDTRPPASEFFYSICTAQNSLGVQNALPGKAPVYYEPSPSPETDGPGSPEGRRGTDQMAEGDPLWSISRHEAVRLCNVYADEIGMSYPFLDLANVTRSAHLLYDALDVGARHGFGRTSLPVPAGIHPKETNVIKMVLANALIIETSGSSPMGKALFQSVKGTMQQAIWDPPDIMSIISYTLLVSRSLSLISFSCPGARWCLGLGMNKACHLKSLSTSPEDQKMLTRLFWCIYILDNRWGYGRGLPFVIQADDIDPSLPEPDDDVPFLKVMVDYWRICGKVWYATYSNPHHMHRAKRKEEESYMEFLITQWYDNIPEALKFNADTMTAQCQPTPRGIQRLQVLLYLRACQLRILLYQPVLGSTAEIRSNRARAEVVVNVAKDMIKKLDYLGRRTDIYLTQQMCFNHFLMSALGVIFTAASLAPSDFLDGIRDEFATAISLIRDISTKSYVSTRLWKMTRALRTLARRAGLTEDSSRKNPDIVRDGPPGGEGPCGPAAGPLVTQSQDHTGIMPSPRDGQASDINDSSDAFMSGDQITQELQTLFDAMDSEKVSEWGNAASQVDVTSYPLDMASSALDTFWS